MYALQFGGLWIRRNKIDEALGRSISNFLFPSLRSSRYPINTADELPTTQDDAFQDKDTENDTGPISAGEEKQDFHSWPSGGHVAAAAVSHTSPDWKNDDVQNLRNGMKVLYEEVHEMRIMMMQYYGGSINKSLRKIMSSGPTSRRNRKIKPVLSMQHG